MTDDDDEARPNEEENSVESLTQKCRIIQGKMLRYFRIVLLNPMPLAYNTFFMINVDGYCIL